MTLLAGSLADLDLVTIAGVTSLGRTSLRLEVIGADGALVGAVVLKAGRVVSASAGALHGHNALHVILNAAATARFRLLREPLDFVLTSALASVDELPELARAVPRLARDSTSQPVVSRTQSQPHVVPMPDRAKSRSEAPLPTRPARATGSHSAPLPAPPAVFARGTRVRMMEGRLDEFDLGTLLSAVGLGRTCVELDVLDAAGAQLGAVWLKAGKIVAARAGHIEGMAALSQLLGGRSGVQFAAFRLDADLGSVPALADVADVLASPVSAPSAPAAPRSGAVRVPAVAAIRPAAPSAAHAAPGDASRTPILEGSLDDFDVPTLLQTVATGRQYCELELLRDKDVLGHIRIKAGVVVSAAFGAMTGLLAMQRLVRLAAPCWFRLTRLTEAVSEEPPIGALDKLLFAAVTEPAPAVSAPPADDEEDFDPPTVADPPRRRGSTSSRPAAVPAALTRATVRSLPDADELARSRHSAPPEAPAAAQAAQLAVVRPEPPRIEEAGPPTRNTVKSLPPVTRAQGAAPAPTELAALGPELVPLMDGTLMDFDLRTLLEVLAVTRQHSRLVLLDAHDHIIGEVRMKAGFVLSVQAAGKSGAEALALMLALPRVYRFRVLSDLQAVSNEWIGSIANLLAAATVRNSDSGDRPTRFLWAAIPISFAIGGAIVFFLARADRPKSAPPTSPIVAQAPLPSPAPTPVAPRRLATEAAAGKPANDTTANVPGGDAAGAGQPDSPKKPANDASATAPNHTPAPANDATAGEPAAATEGEPGEPVMVGMSVRNAQNALRKLGYNPGPTDNRYGKRTRAAIMAFQASNRLPKTGYLDRETWSGIVAALTAQ